jgi:DNA adenine methylase
MAEVYVKIKFYLEQHMSSRVRPFLKWPGGKFKLVDKILQSLPARKTWVEPFVGAGAVFLNVQTEHAILNDINPDLIHLYKTLQTEGAAFIDYAAQFFIEKNNCRERYYALRKKFNNSDDIVLRSALFLYLNRHGYNGLCRYNQSGQFNVPFGQYKNPGFLRDRLLAFHQKSQQATFTCQDYRMLMQNVDKNSVVYCDPPYVPLTATAQFTQYSKQGFTWQDQQDLADLARSLAQKGVSVLISNHNLPMVRKAYHGARIATFPVERRISCNAASRRPVSELLALFE